MLARIEVQSLKLAADKIVNLSEFDVITHATDSTTRKKVGCFAPQGLHVSQETYIPLPTLQLGSEITKNISDSIATGFEMMAVASDYSARDLYSTVDLHMTDATAHNKGVAKEVANVMNRENEAGQLFNNLTSVPVNESFFDFISPAFPAFSDDVFNGSKNEFGYDVLQTVTMYAKKHFTKVG